MVLVPFFLIFCRPTTTNFSISERENVAETSLSQISPLIEMLAVAFAEVRNCYFKITREDNIGRIKDDNFDVKKFRTIETSLQGCHEISDKSVQSCTGRKYNSFLETVDM